MSLPRPGLIGIIIRLALGLIVLQMLVGAVVDAPSYWDGITTWPIGIIIGLIVMVTLTSWVFNKLFERDWGWRPSAIAAGGLAITAAISGVVGAGWSGPAFGVYFWIWTLVFGILLAPAFFLAAILRTPGCEMRSYVDLRARLTGGDPTTVACPGWIDRADSIRFFGRF